jgi:hypothetical protein
MRLPVGHVTIQVVSPESLYDLSCVAHVHSTYSDGTATVPELLAAARATEADALLLTDHDSLGARRDGWEGVRDGVFLLVGTEISPKQGHYLAFGVETELPHAGRSELEIAAAVRDAGGIGFAAHPFSTGGHMLIPALARVIVPPHGWQTVDDERGCDGIELWSVGTDAAEAWRTPAEAIRWLRDPEAAVAAGPPPHQVARWDALSTRRRLPAIGGLDDHQRGIRVRGRAHSPLPPERTFALLRTHLVCERPLSGDVGTDRATVVEALGAGAAWLTCPLTAPAHGAHLWAERNDGSTVLLGGEAPAGPAVLRLRLPAAADVVVRRDGTPIHRAETNTLDLDIRDAGAYRIDATINGRFWLLSNPVHLR